MTLVMRQMSTLIHLGLNDIQQGQRQRIVVPRSCHELVSEECLVSLIVLRQFCSQLV